MIAVQEHVKLSYQDSDMDTDPDPDTPIFLKAKIRIRPGNGKYKQYNIFFIIFKNKYYNILI
jgi:hypothetical protein